MNVTSPFCIWTTAIGVQASFLVSMLQKDASNYTCCYCNKQEVTVIATHPVVPPRRLTQVMGTPVRYHILIAAIVPGHYPSPSIPAFVIASIVHDRTILTIIILTAVVLTTIVLMMIIFTMIVLVLIVAVAIIGLGCHGRAGEEQSGANG